MYKKKLFSCLAFLSVVPTIIILIVDSKGYAIPEYLILALAFIIVPLAFYYVIGGWIKFFKKSVTDEGRKR